MANIENTSYPLTGLPGAGRLVPGLSDDISGKGEPIGENLIGLIRQMIDDENSDNSSQPLPKQKGAKLAGTTPVGRQRTNSNSKVRRSDGGVLRKAMSALMFLVWRLVKPIYDRVKTYRPTRKHLFFAVLAMVVFLRPWLIPGLIAAIALIIVITWLTIGPDRMAEIFHGLWLRLRARRPELADRIRCRFQAVVARMNKGLNWLPGKWATRLYVPDFSESDEQVAHLSNRLCDRPDPFDRLDAKARQP